MYKMTIVAIFLITGCTTYHTKKPVYAYCEVSWKQGINKNEISKLTKRHFFESHFFGKIRFGYYRSYSHHIYKAIRCQRGIIVELGSCLEALNCRTRFTSFEITEEEMDRLFDSTSTFIDSIGFGGHIRKVFIQRPCLTALIEEFDTVQKTITNIFFDGWICSITRSSVSSSSKAPEYGITIKADLKTARLPDFTKPFHYIWSKHGDIMYRRAEKDLYEKCQ